MTQATATLGFRAHTGWAAAVALAGPPAAPRVIDRRRLELAAPGGSADWYHQARELSGAAAARKVREGSADAHKRARAAVRALIEQLAAQGYRVVASGLPLGNTRLPSSLEAILRSHALVHSAEGELFRQVLVSASEAAELAVTGVPARQLYAQAAARLHLGEAELKRRLTDLGAAVGAPWGQDQKEAALSAWLALLGR
ncbi:MAG TPA: hypothetical protein VKN99_15550 [Polyangia bacterium]|nr:hypothetical protein [Polyangia bacterium]